MPNPVRPLRTTKGLSHYQKMIVKQVRRAGLKPVEYHRARVRGGRSVHDPFLDVKRRATKGQIGNVRRYPQALDTKTQARLRLRGRNIKSKRYLSP